MESQYIAMYLLQVTVFGGAGYILNYFPKGMRLHVSIPQVVCICIPGIGLLVALFLFIRYAIR